MKIVIFDPYKGKFTTEMQKWWESNGHEVKRDTYYDPKLIPWGDIIYFETCDNNLKMAMYPDKNDPEFEGWDMHDMDLTGKRIVVRPIDIEVWQGHQHNVDWNLVNDVIFIAPHIQEVANRFEGLRDSAARQHVIPCAVDLDKYTFKKREAGKKVGIVAEVWESKGVDLILQIALQLKDRGYEFHWVGKHQDYEWDKAYTYDFIKRNNLPITFYDWVDSIDEFLEDKNYLLHASKKEAFSYATAEAMAKGIKPVVHHFYGADDLWPGMTWDSIDEAVEMLTNDVYDSESYRQYLIDKGYVIDAMMNRISKEVFDE